MRAGPFVLVLALALAGCSSDWLPSDATAPRLGDHTTRVADLPPADQLDWWSHWEDGELLLVRSLSWADGAMTWHVYDAGSRTRTEVCSIDLGEPTIAGWREDVGFWELVDGELVIWDYASNELRRCTSGGEVLAHPLPDLWPFSTAFGPGGVMAYQADGTPIWIDWGTGEVETSSGPLEPIVIEKRPFDTQALWVTTYDESSHLLTLHELEAATRACTILLQVELGDSDLIQVISGHPQAFVFEAGAFTWGSSVDVGGPPQPIGSTGLTWGTILPYPDGTGFIVWGTGTSVDLVTGRAHTGGEVALGGWHFEREGSWDRSTITVTANNAQGTPDAPYASWVLDLGVSEDWLGPSDEENVLYARGFHNGACVVGRDYRGMALYIEGKPRPEQAGDIGWHDQQDVFYTGACGERPSLFSRNVGMYFGLSPQRTIKHDLPIAEAQMGRCREGEWCAGGDYDAFDPIQSAWVLDEQGRPSALYELMSVELISRWGGVAWVRDGDAIYWVDAAEWD